MKRILIGLVLALVLVFAVGSASQAAPLTIGEPGTFFVFGEYAPMTFLIPAYGLEAGIGYVLTDYLAIGAEFQYMGGLFMYGAFANLYLKPVVISGEVLFGPLPTVGKLTGLYTFDLKPFTLGLGGGAVFVAGNTEFFLEAAASLAAGENFALYGAVDYWLDLGYVTFKGGVTFWF